jgi:hypothetical protein
MDTFERVSVIVLQALELWRSLRKTDKPARDVHELAKQVVEHRVELDGKTATG